MAQSNVTFRVLAGTRRSGFLLTVATEGIGNCVASRLPIAAGRDCCVQLHCPLNSAQLRIAVADSSKPLAS